MNKFDTNTSEHQTGNSLHERVTQIVMKVIKDALAPGGESSNLPQPASNLQLQLCLVPMPEIVEFKNALIELPEDVAQLFLDQLLCLLDGARLELVIASGSVATGTRNQIARLRIIGLTELVAAAVAAS